MLTVAAFFTVIPLFFAISTNVDAHDNTHLIHSNVHIDGSKPTVQQLSLLLETDGSCTLSSFGETQRHRLLVEIEDVIVERRQSELPILYDGHPATVEQLRLFGYSPSHVWSKAEELCTTIQAEGVQSTFDGLYETQQVLSTLENDLEVFPLVVSGPSENRVDIVFFSDGYTLDEKEKFIADAKRLAVDMSYNQTFSSVRTLMNFWAAFSPSRESGIGVGGVPRDTFVGLYRDGTELRAVYCSKPEIARQACQSLHTQCDYPILLGNDPLYGGLGGEFTISTASEINGALVLRHELGHSIINIGEEYDGGYVYSGVNALQHAPENSSFKWAHWISNPSLLGKAPRIERSVMPFQTYPWTLLNKTSPWTASFTSSGSYSRYLVRFSLSGLPEAEHLSVALDGEDLKWQPRPDVQLDRWHYDIYRSKPLSGGTHELSFTLGDTALEGTAQICSAEIIEYGNDTEFNSTFGNCGLYPTFSMENTTTYRPTNEQCLMRIVTSPSFCSVCLEGLWMSLLKRVSLVDDVSVHIIDSTSYEVVVLTLDLIPFHPQASPVVEDSYPQYSIRWEKDGRPMPQYFDQSQITAYSDVYGQWRAFVQLHTAEVKSDPYELLSCVVEIEIFSGDDNRSIPDERVI
ncbi:IgA peptidase M64-domain-containing protein [Hysterangium stoloniferum]|nr:IgA peptidase M64-domain-containing protein [Hysterangium stoloniferum]